MATNDAPRRVAFLSGERRIVALVIAIKLVLFTFGTLWFLILEDKPISSFVGWLEIWTRWDTWSYLSIARNGYQSAGEDRFLIVFYPLFPWLIRALTFVTRNYTASALLVSSMASIAVGVLLWRLVRLDFSSDMADRAVWFLFIFPTSYFLHVGYTESLFLALVVCSFLTARRERWWLAGLLGGLAALTRTNGLLLIVALAVEALQQYRTRRRWNWGWLWIGCVGLGFGGYLLLNVHLTGDPFKFLVYQRENWHKSVAWPWIGLLGKYNALWKPTPEAHMVGVQEILFVMIGLIATVWSMMKLRVAYATWMAGNWLLFVSTNFVLSVPRFTLVMFPVFILFAQLARRLVWKVVISVWSLAFLVLFLNQFVRSGWAF